MIRIEYNVNKITGIVNTTWVSEVDDRHALIGRQTMTLDEWEHVWKAIAIGTAPDAPRTAEDRAFFKFESKEPA